MQILVNLLFIHFAAPSACCLSLELLPPLLLLIIKPPEASAGVGFVNSHRPCNQYTIYSAICRHQVKLGTTFITYIITIGKSEKSSNPVTHHNLQGFVEPNFYNPEQLATLSREGVFRIIISFNGSNCKRETFLHDLEL